MPVEKCVAWCTKDIRLFDIVSGQGFQDLAQFFIDTGRAYGKVSAVLLSHRTKISRHFTASADQVRKQLLPDISRAVAAGHASSTTNLWTDDFKNVSYITMTVHYIDSAWKLIKYVIFTCNFTDDQRKTGANIEKELIRSCSKFGLETDQFKKLRFVTDRGANVIKALENYERYSCSCHVINTFSV
jgi:hypothetical protein